MGFNLLKGKRGIIFGALNSSSIAWKTAERVVEEGAVITLSNTPVAVRMGEVSELGEKLNAEIIPADATNCDDLKTVFERSVEVLGGKIDFVLHSIGMSPNVRKKTLRRPRLRNARQDSRHLRNLFPQDAAGCQETQRHQ